MLFMYGYIALKMIHLLVYMMNGMNEYITWILANKLSYIIIYTSYLIYASPRVN